jgi:hypothetical protein
MKFCQLKKGLVRAQKLTSHVKIQELLHKHKANNFIYLFFLVHLVVIYVLQLFPSFGRVSSSRMVLHIVLHQ